MKNSKLIIPVLLSLSLGFASCNKIDEIIEEETPNTVAEEEVWTLKVEAGEKGDAVTKALSLNDNGTIKSEWTQNDEVVVHKYLDNGQLSLVANIGTLSAETSGAHTTFSGSLTSVDGLSVGSKLRLSYPDYNTDYRGQDGTLQYISDRCNFSFAEVEVTDLNTETHVISTTNAAFKNCQAIWKMKFQDADGDINVTSVTIAADYIKNYTSGSLAFVGQITITPATPTNEIWVAVSSMNRDNNYVIKCVTDNSRKLSCVKKGNLQAGKYYTSTLTMTPLDANFITEINTVSDLVQLSNEVSIGKTYEGQTVTLKNDLDLSEIVNFQPIGLSATLPFKGSFNGNHKTISNLKITTESSSANYTGLFGYISGTATSVYDLTLTDCTITSSNDNKTGGIAGFSEGTFTNCTVSGSVTGRIVVGGIVGNASNNNAVMDGCSFSGSVTATKDKKGDAGGIVGLCGPKLVNCTNNGTVTGTNRAGGITAQTQNLANDAISTCTNHGDVTGITRVGGIVGQATGAKGIINCTNHGKVKSTGKGWFNHNSSKYEDLYGSFTGGIVGWNDHEGSETIISGCINNGAVEAVDNYVGGIIGWASLTNSSTDNHDTYITITGCENNGAVQSAKNCVGGIVGATSVGRKNAIIRILSCVNTESVTGVNYVGGIAGQLNGTTYDYAEISGAGPSKNNLENNLNLGAVSGTSYKGGIAGGRHNDTYGQFNYVSNFYTSASIVSGGVNGVDQEGARGAYKIVGAGGVTVTPTTTEDVQHDGVKYFVSGKEVTLTLSGGSSYSAVDGASNPVTLTDNGGGSYTLTMPAADVTISAN